MKIPCSNKIPGINLINLSTTERWSVFSGLGGQSFPEWWAIFSSAYSMDLVDIDYMATEVRGLCIAVASGDQKFAKPALKWNLVGCGLFAFVPN